MRVYAEEVEKAVFDCLIENLKDDREIAKNALALVHEKDNRGSALEKQRNDLKKELATIEADERTLLISLREKLTLNSTTLTWLDEQIFKIKGSSE